VLVDDHRRRTAGFEFIADEVEIVLADQRLRRDFERAEAGVVEVLGHVGYADLTVGRMR
jgi:hypothetical protein